MEVRVLCVIYAPLVFYLPSQHRRTRACVPAYTKDAFLCEPARGTFDDYRGLQRSGGDRIEGHYGVNDRQNREIRRWNGDKE
ncbi:unnamed protein product, partial [Nesidiocoris tenuis]